MRIPESRFWGIAGAIFWILALGPYLRVLGEQIRIPLPYLLLHNYLPFFSLTGVPMRFDVMLKFCMAILASYAVRDLIRVYLPGVDDRRKSYRHHETDRAKLIKQTWRTSGREILFVTIIGILICVEYLPLPYTTNRVDVPQFYRQMAKDPDEYGVIDTAVYGPSRPSRSHTLYYATIHKKPIVGGYISRSPKRALRFLEETPIIATLINGKPALPTNQVDDALSTLAAYNIRYVITHNNEHRAFLEELLRLEKIHDLDGIKVYDCRRRIKTVNDKAKALEGSENLQLRESLIDRGK